MKKRLDLILTDRALAPSRTQAQALIMAGQVSANGKILDKPGVLWPEDIELHLKHQRRYVSRAGEKLASVAGPLGLSFEGKVVLDVGSSTGGFTDFALQNGASKVYGVDVGTSQMSYTLRQDGRVVVMEKTDIREAVLPELVDMAVIDVSFISLTKILESVVPLVKPGGPIVAMAKPQFEAGKEIADRFHGIISDERVRLEIIDELRLWLSDRFVIENEYDSEVTGMEGNRERFFLLRSK